MMTPLVRGCFFVLWVASRYVILEDFIMSTSLVRSPFRLVECEY